VLIDACGGHRRARLSTRPNFTAWRARHSVVAGCRAIVAVSGEMRMCAHAMESFPLGPRSTNNFQGGEVYHRRFANSRRLPASKPNHAPRGLNKPPLERNVALATIPALTDGPQGSRTHGTEA